METEKSWTRFLKSGKVNDYLTYVNSCKENEISEGISNAVYNGSVSYKGNECRGE